MVDSPSLLAKKQQRDAKLKKLKDILNKSQELSHLELPTQSGESSSEQQEQLQITSRQQQQSKPDLPPANKEEATTKTKNGKPKYLTGSYQHQHAGDNMDIEQGGGGNDDDTEEKTQSQQSSRVNNNSNLSLRDEVQSLIHHNPDGDVIADHSTVLEKMESNPQKVLGIIFLFLFMWWFAL